MQAIHIAFCVGGNYIPYVTVSIKSIVENHRNGTICIHILTNRLSKKLRGRLSDVVSAYSNVRLEIHLVDDYALTGLKTGAWTIYTWYRLLLPEILPDDVKKVLYLDADTLIMADLSELAALDMTDRSIAAVLDPMSFTEKTFVRCGYDAEKLYVCAGVMLMNLDYWRKHRLMEKIIEWSRMHADDLEYPDQDAINYACRDSKIVLPFRFGILNYFQYERFYKPPYFEEIKECIEKPVIVHYANCYPWLKDWNRHPFHLDWLKYNDMLRHPVRRTYRNKGWLAFKLWLWDTLHPRAVKALTKGEVVLKIRQIEQSNGLSDADVS